MAEVAGFTSLPTALGSRIALRAIVEQGAEVGLFGIDEATGYITECSFPGYGRQSAGLWEQVSDQGARVGPTLTWVCQGAGGVDVVGWVLFDRAGAPILVGQTPPPVRPGAETEIRVTPSVHPAGPAVAFTLREGVGT